MGHNSQPVADPVHSHSAGESPDPAAAAEPLLSYQLTAAKPERAQSQKAPKFRCAQNPKLTVEA